jgi:hypothetical protein
MVVSLTRNSFTLYSQKSNLNGHNSLICGPIEKLYIILELEWHIFSLYVVIFLNIIELD